MLPLRVGFGVDNETFGPELGLGAELAEEDSERDVVIVKVAFGGLAIEHFLPGTGLYTAMVRETNAVRERLNATHEFCGLAWMQGESDSVTTELAGAYESQFRSMVAALRRDLRAPTMPVVAGLVCETLTTIWPNFEHTAIVRRALSAVADATVETNDLNLTEDNVHFDGPGLMLLGRRYARALTRLERNREASRAYHSEVAGGAVRDREVNNRLLIREVQGGGGSREPVGID